MDDEEVERSEIERERSERRGRERKKETVMIKEYYDQLEV